MSDVAIRVHEITKRTYQFIRLFLLFKCKKNEALPCVDRTFIRYAIFAVTLKPSQGGRKRKHADLDEELSVFYREHFESVLSTLSTPGKLDRSQLKYNLGYIEQQCVDAILINVKTHYIRRLRQFINITAPQFETDLRTDREKRAARSQLKRTLEGNLPRATALTCYDGWFTQFRETCLPPDFFRGPKRYLTDYLKKNTQQCLALFISMNHFFENNEHALFQPLSMRTSVVPQYCTFDLSSLRTLFGETKEERNLNIKIDVVQDQLLMRLFNVDNRVFRKKNYILDYIQTDGVGCTILFKHESLIGSRQNTNTGSSEEDSPPTYVQNLSNADRHKIRSEGRNIVGCDPGKFSMVYMADGQRNKLRYNAFQRRTESRLRRSQKVLLKEKQKPENSFVLDHERRLSTFNAKTVDFDKFKAYLLAKTRTDEALRPFYHWELHRKLKWRQFVYARKSEDRFLNRISATFGKNAVIAYGDWSRSSQMRHFVPTKGVGLRRLISKRFTTVLVNEFRTSKLCCNCFKELQYYRANNGGRRRQRVYRCRVCPECTYEPTANKPTNRRFVHRDLSAALNIRMLAVKWIENQTRPPAFSRT